MIKPTKTRDMFAAHALAAIIIRDGAPCNPQAQVKAAYDYADMMLAIKPPKESGNAANQNAD